MSQNREELQKKIAQCLRFIDTVTDKVTVERLKELLADYEEQLRLFRGPDQIVTRTTKNKNGAARRSQTPYTTPLGSYIALRNERSSHALSVQNPEISMFERLLELHSTDVPDCACAKAMRRYIKLEKRSEDAAVKHFQCDDCGRQLLLMVWPEWTSSPVAAAA